uniref:IP09274p n=1 Tax=Drosophila melanogaster TaxID=7227 RepID=Q1ECA1_DROME|nr:IP09274p [Drosophila melanogaster]
MPKSKNLEAVDAMAGEIKEQMGDVLVRAFAQLHIHSPQDPRAFIAAYLMNLDPNEQEMKEKLVIFQADPAVQPQELSDPTFNCEDICPKPE